MSALEDPKTNEFDQDVICSQQNIVCALSYLETALVLGPLNLGDSFKGQHGPGDLNLLLLPKPSGSPLDAPRRFLKHIGPGMSGNHTRED